MDVSSLASFFVLAGRGERRCFAYANLAKTDVANDAAIWNFRFVIAATPQSVFAKVMQWKQESLRYYDSRLSFGKTRKSLSVLKARSKEGS